MQTERGGRFEKVMCSPATAEKLVTPWQGSHQQGNPSALTNGTHRRSLDEQGTQQPRQAAQPNILW